MFSRSLNKEKVQCACSYKSRDDKFYTKPDWLPEFNAGKDYTPSYNIAPTDVTPILVSSSRFRNAAQTDIVLKPMMWGIIPPWHKVLQRQLKLLLHIEKNTNIQNKIYNE